MEISRSTKRRGFPSPTPLVDMVFQLLIFFMLTSVAQIADLFPVTPPESTSASQQVTEPATILVGPDGSLALDQTPVALNALAGALRGRQQRPASVLVKADSGAKSGLVVRILEQIYAAGIDDVILATNRLP
jgi:biopolymer transport protein ExbD